MDMISTADLNKSTGYDYIPYTALKNEKCREWMVKTINHILDKKRDPARLFESKMAFINKNKDGSIPTLSQIRLITCTCIT